MIQLYWVALKTIWIKEVTRFGRIWVQTLIPPVITMSLYFVIFGNLIGKRIGDMGGVDYMQFIVPGLIMMAVITNSYANVSSSFFGAKFQRSIEELLVSPVPTHVVIAGFVGGGCRPWYLCWDIGHSGFTIFCTTRDTLLDNGCGDIINDLDCFFSRRIVECHFCENL